MPNTVGELRRRLKELGDPWEVDPRLDDSEPLPNPPRGGQSVEEVPPEDRLVPIDPAANIDELIVKMSPSNPYLLRQWVEVGLLDRRALRDVQMPFESGEDGA